MRRLGTLAGNGQDEAEGITFDVVDPTWTYAAQFNAPSWLEVPCQALWFAMQSRINGDLTHAESWLQQFWTKLEEVKRGATEATWPEILALDAQSQIQGANILTAIINQMTADASTASALMGPFGWMGSDAKDAIGTAQALRLEMLQRAQDMAAQAGTAQAQRVQAVADGRISQDEAQAAMETTTVDAIIRANSSILPGGIPWWVWAGGALGLVLLLRGKR